MKIVNHQYIRLWEEEAPGSLFPEPEEVSLPDVHIPTLQVYLPPAGTATGAAFVVCPGGGYIGLADHEGAPVAEWLASQGITSFILRYRLGPTYIYPTQLIDVRRALRLVRAHAPEWQLDAQRIGIIGFSAGGHLTSLASTYFTAGDPAAVDPIERVSSRPDAQIAVYPVISFPLSYQPVTSLLAHDKHPAPELFDELSTNRHVTSQTPPAFLVHTTNDRGVVVENSDLYAESLKAAGVPYEYVRGDFGDHGFGLDDHWTVSCHDWLQRLHFARV
ncbi:alpha/beta hydrolase [Tengunoibacter tsumagoiensis]|uniref:Endo-1,4-beta-xylanase n=1 Tax=Tengunoibacter tsumagoiensis TaxID=2014871 RepID=A0A402A3Z9_9CHLR|nr:alpha/beta hydrolase [Tengunoibacter tsumagoiensis]GCE13776.1 endo-1,4-beta-xylanase [Tengunoibacter tsumagoiensis]